MKFEIRYNGQLEKPPYLTLEGDQTLGCFTPISWVGIDSHDPNLVIITTKEPFTLQPKLYKAGYNILTRKE